MADVTALRDELDEDAQLDDATALGKGGALNAVGAVCFALLGFALVTIITRSLGARGAGAFLEAVAVFSILTRTSVLGADISLVRFVARYRGLDRVSNLRPMLLVALVPVGVAAGLAAVLLLLVAGPLGRVIGDPATEDQIATYLRLLAPFIPVAALYMTLDGCAQGFGSMVPSVTVERIGRPLLVAGLVLGTVVAGSGTTALAVSWATPWAIGFVAIAVWVTKLLTQAEGPDPGPPHIDRRTLATRFWRFAVPRSLGAMLQMGILWADTLLLGALASTREAGVYAASTRFLIVGTFAGMAITTAFAPQISMLLSQGERDRTDSLFKTATVWFILLAWPIYLTVAIFSPALVETFGSGFDDGAIVLTIVGLAFLYASSAGPIDMLLLMGGRSTLSLVNNVAALAVNIVLNLALIPSMGLRGAALAWSASLVLTNLLPTLEVHHTMGHHPYGRTWLRAVLVAAGTVALPLLLVRAVLGPDQLGLAVGLTVAAITYGSAVFVQREHFHIDAFLSGLRRRQPKAPQTGVPPVLPSATTPQ